MVWAPASSPRASRSARRLTISSFTSAAMAVGEVRGRRERGSNAVSPSARYRATSLVTCERDRP